MLIRIYWREGLKTTELDWFRIFETGEPPHINSVIKQRNMKRNHFSSDKPDILASIHFCDNDRDLHGLNI